ncbi:DciA family protein [Candidatus Margulisiibacteriota bacterium]
MDKIYNILKKNKKFKTIDYELYVTRKIKDNWEKYFGKLAKDLEFSFYRNGILQIEVINYMWVSEINYYKKKILQSINDSFGKKNIVRDIWITKKTTVSKNKAKKSIDRDLSFEDKIALENKRKKKCGYTLCEICKNILTNGKICIFCKNSNNSQLQKPR